MPFASREQTGIDEMNFSILHSNSVFMENYIPNYFTGSVCMQIKFVLQFINMRNIPYSKEIKEYRLKKCLIRGFLFEEIQGMI